MPELPERKTVTLHYKNWKNLRQLQVDKELWGHDQAIKFLLDFYKASLVEVTEEVR